MLLLDFVSFEDTWKETEEVRFEFYPKLASEALGRQRLKSAFDSHMAASVEEDVTRRTIRNSHLIADKGGVFVCLVHCTKLAEECGDGFSEEQKAVMSKSALPKAKKSGETPSNTSASLRFTKKNITTSHLRR